MFKFKNILAAGLFISAASCFGMEGFSLSLYSKDDEEECLSDDDNRSIKSDGIVDYSAPKLTRTKSFLKRSEKTVKAIEKLKKKDAKKEKKESEMYKKLNKISAKKVFDKELLTKISDLHRIDLETIKNSDAASIHFHYIKNNGAINKDSLKMKWQMGWGQLRGSLPETFK